MCSAAKVNKTNNVEFIAICSLVAWIIQFMQESLWHDLSSKDKARKHIIGLVLESVASRDILNGYAEVLVNYGPAE